jgi:tRNA A-37 threonylcarbamoyl transferase component Bud32
MSVVGFKISALISALGAAAYCACVHMWARIRPIHTLSIRAGGLEFDSNFKKVLFGRLTRSWADVQQVCFTYDPRVKNEIEWATAPGATSDNISWIRILFKSGGEAKIPVCCITGEQATSLFGILEASLPPDAFETDAARLWRLVLLGEKPTMDAILEKKGPEVYFATNHALLPAGTSLQSGRYRVLTQLSAGGMSATYLSTTADGDTVVLKESSAVRLENDSAEQIKAKELFERETKLLSRLSHPQLAKVLDAFTENNRDYMVLEHIRGSNLRALITKTGSVNEQRAITWMKELCAVVQYLHQQDPPVIHRDISPDNIVVREDGHIALIDFGAATEYLGNRTGTFVGKQAYMAPEQVRGRATPGSDIYAIGATFFFMVTGQDPTPLTCSHPSKVSAACDEIVSTCTKSEEDERYASTRELIWALNKAACGATQ